MSFCKWAKVLGAASVTVIGRRDFRLDALTQASGYVANNSLFAHLGKHEIFAPIRTYPPMKVGELAAAALGDRPKEVA